MTVAPVLIGAPVLIATHRRFPLTTLLDVLIALHALVLILGAAYTYARVYVAGRRMAVFLSGCVALAIGAFYERIEWWAALALGQGADPFLGTQGDPWDTHSDMFMALIGAVTALLTLARFQDRQIERLSASEAGGTLPAGG